MRLAVWIALLALTGIAVWHVWSFIRTITDARESMSSAISPPAALVIPSLGVVALVAELGVLSSGEMEAPEDGGVVGWYRTSARAGQPGNLVMSGHVDWNSVPGVFWGLRQLVVGSRLVVRARDGTEHTYEVEWNRTFRWNDPSAAMLVGGVETALCVKLV